MKKRIIKTVLAELSLLGNITEVGHMGRKYNKLSLEQIRRRDK